MFSNMIRTHFMCGTGTFCLTHKYWTNPKDLALANTLAYSAKTLMKKMYSFILFTPVACTIKLFFLRNLGIFVLS